MSEPGGLLDEARGFGLTAALRARKREERRQARSTRSGDVTVERHSIIGSGRVPNASEIPYDPAVATDWDGDADPGDIDDALDQLAERVDDLEAGTGLYSVVDYVFFPQAAPDADIETGDSQDWHRSGPSAETIVAIYTDCLTAPTGANALFELEYADGEDWDTASWPAGGGAQIEEVTHTAGAKSIKSTSSAGNSIPADRLIRLNINQVGSTVAGQNAKITLRVKRPLIT